MVLALLASSLFPQRDPQRHQSGDNRLTLASPHIRDILAASPVMPVIVLDRVEDGRGMRLHRHPVLRLQNPEIERGHDRGERGR